MFEWSIFLDESMAQLESHSPLNGHILKAIKMDNLRSPCWALFDFVVDIIYPLGDNIRSLPIAL